MEEEADTTYSFGLLFMVHEADEAEANKRLAELLDKAEELGFELFLEQPDLARRARMRQSGELSFSLKFREF